MESRLESLARMYEDKKSQRGKQNDTEPPED